MSKWKKYLAGMIACVIVFFVIYLIWHHLFGRKKPKIDLTPHVVATKSVTKNYQEHIEVTGSLRANEGTMISPDLAGRVVKVYFKSGQSVKKGDPLVQIYPNTVQAQLEQAQAQYIRSVLDYQRFLKLYQTKFASKMELDRYQATMKNNKGLVDQYNSELNQLLIKAPFTGKLGIRLIDLGNYLSQGQSIVSLQALNPIYVDFSVSQRYLTYIALGNKVILSSEAFGKTTYVGKVFAFNSMVDKDSRMLDIRASVKNPKDKLLPGTFVMVSLYFGQPENYVEVPQTAIIYDTQGTYVYVLDTKTNTVKKVYVTEKKKIKNNMDLIEKGLKVGDVVITKGQLKLEDGMKVYLDKIDTIDADQDVIKAIESQNE